MPVELATATESEPPKLRTDVLVLIASGEQGGEPEEERLLQAEVDRINKFRSRGRGWALSPMAVSADSLESAASLIREHRPGVVHFRGYEWNSVFGEELPEDFLKTFSEDAQNAVTCVVLENCYSLDIAEPIADHVRAVVGINGPFAENFLSTFYARLIVDGPYYELFSAALYSFDHHYGEVKATAEERPYFITTDQNPVVEGRGSLTFGRVPGVAIMRGVGPAEPPKSDPIAYPLFFGTNRKRVDPNDVTRGYSGERDTTLHLGMCLVKIPKSHKIGSLGSGWWERMRTGEDDRLTIDWQSLREYAESEYYELIRNKLPELKNSEPSNVLFIHGFRTSFDAAALRAAQLGADLKVDGIMAFFSWPSKGRFRSYTADEASMEASEPYLIDYISKLGESVGDGHLHVIAHSMGNRGLLRAMQQLLVRAAQRTGVHFGQIFLAAADIDAETFRNLAQAYKSMAVRTTLYVSSKDRALASSAIFHEYDRAGFVPPVTIVDGVDTVETASIDLSFLGHGYFADARPLLEDIHGLIRKDTAPAKRLGLRPATHEGHPYWIIY